ncbi:MAG: hypothetical protein L3J52_09215 [Proteobacteria bacterium]|nr:hypothetical protein [Pseudomonadota bacterium]
MSDKDLLTELKKILNHYLGTVSQTKAVFIATLDGHLLLERSREQYPLDQVSPMAGSLLGIAETVASQLLEQKLHDNIVMMDQETLALLKIHDQEDSLFLGIICDRMVNIGKMLTYGRVTINSINVLLKEQQLV